MRYFPDKNTFISLKWKYAFIISGAILLLYALLSWGIYNKAKNDVEKQYHVKQLEQISVLHDLIDYSGQVMEQFADSLSQLKLEKPEYIAKHYNPYTQLTDVIEQYWLDWQIIWGLENIYFYQVAQGNISHWGESAPDLNKLYQLVIQTERPQQLIICQNRCVLYVAVPILIYGKLEAVISVGKSIAEILITFEKITKADIGLWANEKIPAMTNEKNNRPLLKSLFLQAQLIKSIPGNANIQIAQILFRKQHYYISFSPVNHDNKASFIVINNIEYLYQNLQTERKNIFFTGLFSLFVTLLLLFYLLEKSLIRIKYFSSALPFLAKNDPQRYQKVRDILIKVKPSKYGYDEMDQLKTTSLKLSEQLEQLEGDSKLKSQQIEEKHIELRNERDFIHQLIEAAPIYIITQNLKGKIISANHRCSELLKMNNEDIIRMNFEQLFTTVDSEHYRLLQKFRQAKTFEIINIDDALMTEFGINSSISWLHTFIYNKNSNQEAQILSLGIDITERKLAEEKSLWIASHDPLTNLPNRRYFHAEFETMLSIAARYQKKVALLYLDLDQFKIINDTQGHEAGDQLLVQVSDSLSQLRRKSDLLCRIGGDEFAIVTPISKTQEAISLAKKINQLIKNIEVSNTSYQVGLSIGITIYPEHGNSFHELLANADLAMYKAKESGFNQYHIFDIGNNYHQELNKKLEWKQFIEKAIDEKWLTLYYQPILDLQTQTITHYECLLRIINDIGDIIGPTEFIQFAEELGLIATIDILVINLAIEQHLELQQNDKKNLKLAINLSGRSINNNKVKAEIKSLLKLPGVCSEKIIFEITETSAVTNFISAQSFINEIRILGCQVALDDFGTGFSSFYYLKHMSFDYIKIDGAFIQRIETDKEDKIFVKALSDVARALGKKTIAEFVETETTIKILQELHIDYAQGYYISKPLPEIIID